jgi:hypothetical protein
VIKITNKLDGLVAWLVRFFIIYISVVIVISNKRNEIARRYMTVYIHIYIKATDPRLLFYGISLKVFWLVAKFR